MNLIYNTNKIYLISILLFLLYVLPWIVFGENSYVLIHDNLDGMVTLFTTLIESSSLYSSSYIPMPMYMEAPRVSFGSEYNLQLLYYYYFEPYTAYILNQILIRLIGFLGMYFLLKYYVLGKEYDNYNVLMSLSYSLLPYWSAGGLSVAGLPLITYIFLNIKNHKATFNNYFILVLFPFYSSFVISMMFYIFVLGLVWLNELRLGKLNKSFTISIFVFIGLYLLVNYRLFEAFFISSDFVSHRIERIDTYKTFFASVKSSIDHFLKGQYHTSSLHIVFLPLILFVFFHNYQKGHKNKIITILFILNIAISLWYGFWKYEGWIELKENISLLRSLNLSRFHSLVPLIWYVLFAVSLKYFIENIKYNKKVLIISSIFIINFILLFSKSDYIKTFKKENITYKEFYAQNIFSDIGKQIGINKSEYKVVSLGIHPSIARYNGFYTADGYLANYSLEYKHKFKKIISKELEKNESLNKSFETWGNRCYLFVDEVGYNFKRKKENTYPIEIDIEAQALRDLDIKFLFSSYQIKNANINQLKFIKLFTDKESAWDIYLYQVLEKK